MPDLKTPLYNLNSFETVYEPSEDSFLLLDAIELELESIKVLNPELIVEIGCGSGIAITALSSTFKNAFCLATDINLEACKATRLTSNLNAAPVDILNMHLLDSFKSNIFDVIIFNPPYVVTDSSEVAGTGLNRAWAGGSCGREIINNVLFNLPHLLSDEGVCYMVLLSENNPKKIKEEMNSQKMDMQMIIERKIRGEHLFVYKFFKTDFL